MRRFAARLLILVLCAFGLSAAARAERRVALLIGNAAYREAALRNPVNDVAAMKAVLAGAGFDTVIARTDLDRTGMLQALRSFEDAVGGADIGVVFYSGHGIEFRGQNYLLPVDAHIDTDRDIADQAIDLDRVLDSLSGATKLKLVLLDACRSNPFVDGMRRVATKGVASKGLAPVEASAADTLIAYAAAPGHVALDGDGAQSPFTTALVRHLTTPGLDVELALRRARDDVVAATDHGQVPFKTGSLGGDEILLGRPAPDGSTRPPPIAAEPAKSAAPVETAMLPSVQSNANPSPVPSTFDRPSPMSHSKLLSPSGTPARDVVTLRNESPLSGATLVNLSPAVAEDMQISGVNLGVVISAVEDRTTAALSGFQKGDVLVDIGPLKVTNTRQVEKATAVKQDFWHITVVRDGRIIESELGG